MNNNYLNCIDSIYPNIRLDKLEDFYKFYLESKNFVCCAIDYGSEKVGISISDQTFSNIFPYKVLKTDLLEGFLLEIIKSKDIKVLIFGMPFKMNGIDIHQIGYEMFDFIYNFLIKNFSHLNSLGKNFKLIFIDERMTSSILNKNDLYCNKKLINKNKSTLDDLSALLIMQVAFDFIKLKLKK